MQNLIRWVQVPRSHNGPVCANTFTPITTYYALQCRDLHGDWVTVGTDNEAPKDTDKTVKFSHPDTWLVHGRGASQNTLSANIENIVREALPNAEVVGRSTTKLFPMLFVKEKDKHYKVSIVIQRADENKFED